MNVKKYSGELVPFEPLSLLRSLNKSGASKAQADAVFDMIKSKLYEGIPTRELYEMAFDCLKKQRNSFAARYSLKKALRDLGPEGFYFEKWVAKLFECYGYQVKTGQTLQGKAVTHEVDVIAQKGDELNFAECKFRNDVDAKISVTTPMYFLSRMKDLSEQSFNFFGSNLKPTHGWLVTNAYLSGDSIKFSECYNINLISWDYPQKSSLKNRVDDKALYPITCLTTINVDDKKHLLDNDCILVQQLIKRSAYLDKLNLTPQARQEVYDECAELVGAVSKAR